ncbi:MAG: 2-hydroxychromene-2-carboxylate isomerase [Gammaproteobacteria bacterium]
MIELVHYFDYKSPYAYLAQAANDALEARYAINLVRVPYTLHIPSYLGAAELDETGRDRLGTRNAHQWRRVRYSYMDCRREANRRGLVIRGPRKIFDSTLAHIGFLYAAARQQFRDYHARVFERFWRRELDLEDPAAIAAVLVESGVDLDAFADFARGEGRAMLTQLQQDAEEAGVFGVPSWILGGELFWGAERLPYVEEMLAPYAR